MDLKDQLKNLFPDHAENTKPLSEEKPTYIWMQDAPIICKYEKRKGKPTTIIEGYTGDDDNFKSLAKDLKKKKI
jgi:translation initiation factor 1